MAQGCRAVTHTVLPNDPPDSCEFPCPQEGIRIAAWTKYLKRDINSEIPTSVDRPVQRQWPGTLQKLHL